MQFYAPFRFRYLFLAGQAAVVVQVRPAALHSAARPLPITAVASLRKSRQLPPTTCDRGPALIGLPAAFRTARAISGPQRARDGSHARWMRVLKPRRRCDCRRYCLLYTYTHCCYRCRRKIAGKQSSFRDWFPRAPSDRKNILSHPHRARSLRDLIHYCDGGGKRVTATGGRRPCTGCVLAGRDANACPRV